jgi:hypothetical protein
MRITWHRAVEADDERTEPAWLAGRPVEPATALRISAPKAGELAHPEVPHQAA